MNVSVSVPQGSPIGHLLQGFEGGMSLEQVYLFVPGDSLRKLEKAVQSGPDVILVDLEDGVAEEMKAEARHTVHDWLSTVDGTDGDSRTRTRTQPKIAVRCNAVSSPHFPEDMRLLRSVQIQGVMLPKCESADHIAVVDQALDGHPLLSELGIIPLIESARGVHRFEAIVSDARHVRRGAFGAADFALDLGVDWTADGEERRYAIGQLVLQSRSLGLDPLIDAVFLKLDDRDAFIRDALYGKQIGCYGKMIIHPRHIEWVRDVYKATEAEIAWCREVIRLYEQSGGAGSLRLDGQLIDLPVYRKARLLLRE